MAPALAAKGCPVRTTISFDNSAGFPVRAKAGGEIPPADCATGDRANTQRQQGSTWRLRLRAGLLSYRYAGWPIVRSELHSCLHRIGLRWKTKSSVLLFEAVAESCPSLELSDHDSQIEMRPYIRGIQALCEDRPWMSLGDIELYLQGWFQAQRVLHGMKDTEPQSAERPVVT